MRIDTTSGVHGTLIEYRTVSESRTEEAVALVKRDCVPFERAPYSTHRVYTTTQGTLVAEAGRYDLTLEEAQKDLENRAPRETVR